MPVVIRELNVQVNVEDRRAEPEPGRGINQRRVPDYDMVIRECVEKVVEIMKKEEQR